MSDIIVGIKLTADGKAARAEIVGTANDLGKLESAGGRAKAGIDKGTQGLKELEAQAKQTRSAVTGKLLEPLGQGADDARKRLDAAAVAAARYAGAAAGIAAAGAASYILRQATEFDRLNASLRTVTGSAELQAKAMDMIKSFAAETPYELQQVTEAFIRLRSLGLDASEKSLRSFGNTASAMGKPMMQFIEAVADASTNEFERLKEFGIKASQEGDKVTFTFRGVSTTVQKTSEDITRYLQNIGNTDFAGGMAQQMDTLGGKASNLADAFSSLADSFATASGLRSGVKAMLDVMTESVTRLRKEMELLTGTAANAPTQALELQMQDLQDRLNEMDNLRAKGFGGFVDDRVYAQANDELRKTSELLAKLTAGAKTAGEEFTAVQTAAGNAGAKIESMSKRQIEIMHLIVAEAKRQGVEVSRALAFGEQESGFNQAARAHTKYGDAIGVGQIIPPTAKSLGIDPTKLDQNIRGMVTLIKRVEDELVAALGDKGHDFQLIAAAYFTGTKNVVDAIKKTGSLPGFSDGNKTVPDYARDLDAKRAKWAGLEQKITADTEDELKKRLAAERDHFDAVETLAKSSAKAQETIAKSSLGVEVAKLDQQKKAFEDYVRSRSGELGGQDQTRFLEQAARQEQAIIEKSVTLKQRALDIERQTTQSELQSVQARIAAKAQLQLSESQVAALMGEQKQLIAELASLDSQSQAVRIQGAGELQNVLAGIADAYAKQAEAAQQAAAARDDYLAKLDAQIKALETGNDLLSKEAELHKLSAGMAADEAKAWEDAAKAKLSQIADIEKAQKDQERNEKSVADQVLRTGQYYEAMVRQAQNAARGMSEAFGDTGAAIGNLLVGLAQYQDTMFNLQQETQRLLDLNKKNGGGEAQEMEIRAQAANKELTYQIQNYGNLTQAAKGFFEEGTSGYQAMENATKVFRAVELAMTLANYIQMATAGAAYTTQDVEQSAVRGQAKAAEGVANQASGGDPYSAFPRMAAMAAAMAAIGFAIAGGVSGGGAPRGVVSRSTKSEGTVFGDSTAQSDSIKNAIELVAKNSSTDLAYSAGMLRSLQNIESAMAGVTNSIIRNVRPADVQGLGTRQTISWDPLAIFMKTTKAITDWGIGAFPQMLKDILSAGFEGKTFTDITTTTKLFGMTLASSTKTVLGDMASETEKQFTLVFRSITDAVREASRAFGTSADQFNTLIETFVVKFDTTSLKGLKGEELENAIAQQFSKIADQIAGALDIKGLDEFQRVGEGMFETLVRVSEGITRANAELDALGVKAIKYSEIQFKQGDVAAEIVRQSIVAFEGLESGLGSFIDQAVGSAEDLIATYQDLLKSRDILKGLGLQWENLNRTMTDAAGGVSAFRDALESFRDNFFSSGAQYATDMVSLAREFGNLGLVLPQSKDEFRALAESIDTSTESGAELFARVIKLSEAFSDAADRAAELERKYKSYTDPFADFKDQIGQVIDDWKAIMDYKLGAIEAEFANKAAVAKQQVNAPYQGSLDLTGARKSTLQEEIAQNVGYLNQTAAEIGRLQDLINRWQGVPKAQAYVAGWRSQMEALQSQADVLVRDLQSKNSELADLNRKIDDLNRQIAQNNADVDTSQLSDKLDALTAERRQLLREQGDAIVRTMQDIWDSIVGVLDDAQRSLQGQIAELQGPNQVSRLIRRDERQATGDLNRYLNRGGNDPEKIASMVTAAQDAIMATYQDQAQRLINKYKRSPEYKEAVSDIRSNAREKIKPIRADLRDDIRTIRADLRADIKPIRQAARQKIREIEDAGEAALEAYRAQVQGQIDSINSAMDAALQALEDRQQAEQDALSDAQDERMQALQDEQQAATKLLQKRHTAEMSALQKQLSTAESLKQTFAQIAQFAQSLKLGELSTLSPEDKLREAQAQYESILAKAKGGDAEAAGQYTGIAQEFARLAQQYFGGNDQYAAIYNRIQRDAESLGGTAVTTDPVEAAIEALQKSQEDELESLQKVQREESRALQQVFRDESRALSRTQQDQVDAVRDSYQAQIDAINKNASKTEEQMRADTQRQIDRIENQTQRQIDKMERVAQRQIDKAERVAQRQIDQIERQANRQIEKLTNINTSPAIKDLKDRTIEKLQNLDGILTSARNMAQAQADQQIRYLSSLNLLNGRQLQQLNKIGKALGGGVTAVPAYAAGGVMKPGPAIVAERGIEPIWFDRGGRVLSNAEAKASLSDGDKKIAQEIASLKQQIQILTKAQVAANSRMVPAVEALAKETAKVRNDQKLKSPVRR